MLRAFRQPYLSASAGPHSIALAPTYSGPVSSMFKQQPAIAGAWSTSVIFISPLTSCIALAPFSISSTSFTDTLMAVSAFLLFELHLAERAVSFSCINGVSKPPSEVIDSMPELTGTPPDSIPVCPPPVAAGFFKASIDTDTPIRLGAHLPCLGPKVSVKQSPITVVALLGMWI